MNNPISEANRIIARDDIVIAFVQTEVGIRPCHVSAIKKGDLFYLVVNGEQFSMQIALSSSAHVNDVIKPPESLCYQVHDWVIHSELFEG